MNGPVLFNIAGFLVGANSAEYCGTLQLSVAQANSLLASGLYVNIHTAAFPGGEVRAQLRPGTEDFSVRATGAQEVPPNGSPNTGFGTYTYNAASNQVTYRQNWTGAGGTMAHVHGAIPGVNGGIVYGLAGPANGPWIGISPAITTLQILDMFQMKQYANIHSGAFPGGEIRGQLIQNPNLFGFPGQTVDGPLKRVLRIGSSGPAVLGGNWTCTLHDAQPGVFASLAYAEDLAINPLDVTGFGFPLCSVLWINALTGYPTTTDALGCATQTFAVPALAVFLGEDFYFQWLAVDGTTVAWSGALEVVVRN